MADSERPRARGGFPSTHWSAILAVRSEDSSERRRGTEAVVEAYWRPVYKYIRIKWRKSTDDAQDLTQSFFATAIEKDFFQAFEPSRARFRTFLRTCLDGFVANQEKAARRIKRGGNIAFLPLDFIDAEGELRQTDLPSPESIDEFFEKEFVRSLFGIALETLEAELSSAGRGVHFSLFERYDLNDGDRVTYRQLAEEFSLPVSTVTNYLALARREFRKIVLKLLRSMSASDDEFRREARALLGIDADNT